MKCRKLRIAWSVVWGVATVLLVVLWVRSYWSWDDAGCGINGNQRLLVSSHSGAIIVSYDDFTGTSMVISKWIVNSVTSPDTDFFPVGGLEPSFAGFLFMGGDDGFMLSIPYWFLVPLTASISALAWIRWANRFSLRALLIAMTLIAGGLGLIVWGAK